MGSQQQNRLREVRSEVPLQETHPGLSHLVLLTLNSDGNQHCNPRKGFNSHLSNHILLFGSDLFRDMCAQ